MHAWPISWQAHQLKNAAIHGMATFKRRGDTLSSHALL
jgi:hypothetical protein